MTTDPPFSIALLGCGAVVQDFYLPVLKSLAGELDVNLCCDIDAKNAERVAGELGATAVTGGLDQLLESPPTDGAVITLPNNLHTRAIVTSLAAGRHVLCEKPVATTSAECDHIEEALAATDRVLSVNMVRRCFPASVALRHLIQSHSLGRLRHIEVAEGGRGGWNSRTGFQFVRDSAGGGVTLDRGSHIFDLLVYWCGTPSLSAYADDAAGGCEATSIANLQWPDGSSATVRMSKVEPWNTRVAVEGELGSAQWTPAEPRITRVFSRDARGTAFESSIAPLGVKANFSVLDALATLFRSWVRACRGTQPNPTPFAEVRVAIDLITKCYAIRQPLGLEWSTFQE